MVDRACDPRGDQGGGGGGEGGSRDRGKGGKGEGLGGGVPNMVYHGMQSILRNPPCRAVVMNDTFTFRSASEILLRGTRTSLWRVVKLRRMDHSGTWACYWKASQRRCEGDGDITIFHWLFLQRSRGSRLPGHTQDGGGPSRIQ